MLVDAKLILFFFASELIIQVLQILLDEIFSLTCIHPHVSSTWMSEHLKKIYSPGEVMGIQK